MRIVLVIATLALLVPAAAASPTGTVSRGSVQVDGLTRTYRAYVPTRPKKPAPVVLVFHGGFGTGARVASQTGFDAEAERRGFIAVYPDGIGRAWNAGPCCGLPARVDLDDIAFVSRLLDKLERQYAIDKRRIFATGISNGGLISYRVACELSNRIAAAAPVATTLVSSCSPKTPVSILHIHGLDDQNIPFEGGQGTRGAVNLEWPPAKQGIDAWRRLDGLSPRWQDHRLGRGYDDVVDAVPTLDGGAAGDDRRRRPHLAQRTAVRRQRRDRALLRGPSAALDFRDETLGLVVAPALQLVG